MDASVAHRDGSIVSAVECDDVVCPQHAKYTVLFVSTIPRAQIEVLGITNPAEEFRHELGLGEGQFRMIDVTCEELPEVVEEHGVIIGGSPHSAYERLPWMEKLEEFIRLMAAQGKPMLGVCFGHQIISQALGGVVEKGTNGRELGVAPIELTEHGKDDLLFEGLSEGFQTAISHSDVVTTLPADARVLARNNKYNHQALAIGECIRSVQFHPEMSLLTVIQLAQSRKQQLFDEKFVESEDHLRTYISDVEKADITAARKVLTNFYRHFVVPHARRKTDASVVQG